MDGSYDTANLYFSVVSLGVIGSFVIRFGTTSQLRRFHDLQLECDERSAGKSHSNQYQHANPPMQ